MSSLYSSKSQVIQTLIKNLKASTSCESATDIISSFKTNQIDCQRTFHLKLLLNQTQYKSFILRELCNNRDYKVMIDDIIQNFDNLNDIEIQDFLNWYRRSLSAGCSSFISSSQSEYVFQFLQEMKVFPKEKSLVSQFFFNFSSLNIFNQSLKSHFFGLKHLNFNSNDICLVLKSMNMNPEFFNLEYFTGMCNGSHHLFNFGSGLRDYLIIYKYYTSVCKNFEVLPNYQFIQGLETKIRIINEGNPVSSIFIARVLLDFSKNLYNSYIHKALWYAKNNPLNVYNSLNLSYALAFNNTTERSTLESIINDLYGIIKNSEILHTSTKTKILLCMVKSGVYDSEIISKCLDLPENSKKFNIYLLKMYICYPEITGKSLLTLEPFKKYESRIKDCYKSLDFIHLNEVLNNLVDCSMKNEFAQEVKKSIENEIVSRSSKDPFLASYYHRMLLNQNRLTQNEDHLILAKTCQSYCLIPGLNNKKSRI